MGKKHRKLPEDRLVPPPHPALSPPPPRDLIDTHTHLLSTFSAYRSAYPDGAHATPQALVRALAPALAALVDVWCEAPVHDAWRDIADPALTQDRRDALWGGIEYWFVMGVHPHNTQHYTDAVEQHILAAMSHPRCVGWGEIGLDYHYAHSPRATQQAVLTRQLRHAVRLGKPLTIHTREAEADTERILKAEVPRAHKIHVHCFTDSPAFAQRLLAHFPHLYIGLTGVLTYATNHNTRALLRALCAPRLSEDAGGDGDGAHRGPAGPRILLETDAPYMAPSTLPARLPFTHSGVLPWTAAFAAEIAREVGADAEGGEGWDAQRIVHVARENARAVYGI